MKIIGEKINGTRAQVKKALSERDAALIQSLAKRQVDVGAHWLDVNAGTPPDRERDDLVWLVNIIQQVVDVPLCFVIRRVLGELQASIPVDRIFVDPLVTTIATNTEGAKIALETMRAVHVEFPGVHLTSGLCNVSFGLPARRLINRAFLTLAVGAGLDTAILDPLDCELDKVLLATEVVLGHDRHCLNYTRAFRAGALG